MSEKVDGILEFYKQYWELKSSVANLSKSFKSNKITLEDYQEKRQVIEESMKTVIQGANEQEEELRFLSKLKKDFYDEK